MTLNLPLSYFVWTEECCQTSPNKNKSPNLWHVTSILVCCIFEDSNANLTIGNWKSKKGPIKKADYGPQIFNSGPTLTLSQVNQSILIEITDQSDFLHCLHFFFQTFLFVFLFVIRFIPWSRFFLFFLFQQGIFLI